MTFNAPNMYIPGIAYLAEDSVVDTNGIFLPLSLLQGLTAEKAHPLYGDVREILRNILKVYFTANESINPVAQRPSGFLITRNNPTALNSGVVRQSYVVSFDFDLGGSPLITEA